jgi:hypothetical protein
LDHFFLYLSAVFDHYLFSFGGVVLLGFAIFEKARHKQVRERIFWGCALLCLFIACYRAWVDEHRNASALIEQKSRLSSDLNICDADSKGKDIQLQSYASRLTDWQGRVNDQQGAVNLQQATFSRCVETLAEKSALPVQSVVFSINYDSEFNKVDDWPQQIILRASLPVQPPVRAQVVIDQPIMEKTAQVQITGRGFQQSPSVIVQSGGRVMQAEIDSALNPNQFLIVSFHTKRRVTSVAAKLMP